MNIEQKELINIIREELAEALGMDATVFQAATSEVEASRLSLTSTQATDLQAAMDVLENVQAMLR